jgi:DNA-binding transcriptional regulator YhcF (GntR family)
VRQLAADLRVNFNTIARSYRQLDEDGIISTQHGRGTFIRESHSAEDVERLRRQDLMRLTRYYLTEAHRLGYSSEEVRAVFEEKLARWINEGEPREENSSGRSHRWSACFRVAGRGWPPSDCPKAEESSMSVAATAASCFK